MNRLLVGQFCYAIQDRNSIEDKNNEPLTHGIVHAGFRGFRAFMAGKKNRSKLIGNRFVIPHATIPSTVVINCKIRVRYDKSSLKDNFQADTNNIKT